MVEIKFVDIKHYDKPRHLWDNHSFAMGKCCFNNVYGATIVCPAIKQIINSKGILYLFNNNSHNAMYVLTDCDKLKNKIKTKCSECLHRIR